MGATGVYFVPADKKAFLTKELEYETDKVKTEVVAMSRHGNDFYAAVKHTPKTGDFERPTFYAATADDSFVEGVVVKTNTYRGEFVFKTMGEFCGPFYFNAAAKVMKQLTPLFDDNSNNFVRAKDWRDTVAKNRAA